MCHFLASKNDCQACVKTKLYLSKDEMVSLHGICESKRGKGLRKQVRGVIKSNYE